MPRQIEQKNRSRPKSKDVVNAEQAAEVIAGKHKAYNVGRGEVALSASATNMAFTSQASKAHPAGVVILDVGRNAHRAWAKVAAYLGSKANPIVYVEDSCIIEFEDLRKRMICDYVDRACRYGKGCPIESEGDSVRLTDPRDTVAFQKLYHQKKFFADREVVTHARRRAQLQCLGKTWQEKEEIETSEEYEVNNIRNQTSPPKVAPTQKKPVKEPVAKESRKDRDAIVGQVVELIQGLGVDVDTRVEAYNSALSEIEGKSVTIETCSAKNIKFLKMHVSGILKVIDDTTNKIVEADGGLPKDARKIAIEFLNNVSEGKTILDPGITSKEVQALALIVKENSGAYISSAAVPF